MKKLLLILFVSFSLMTYADFQPFVYKMYPNPMTSDVLEVSFNLNQKNIKALTFTISNVIGQVVYQHTLSEDEFKKGSFTVKLDDFKLEKGFYLSKLSSGDHTTVQKLIVR